MIFPIYCLPFPLIYGSFIRADNDPGWNLKSFAMVLLILEEMIVLRINILLKFRSPYALEGTVIKLEQIERVLGRNYENRKVGGTSMLLDTIWFNYE